jgi:RimJ/RimL family protein N-acetyltransferase
MIPQPPLPAGLRLTFRAVAPGDASGPYLHWINDAAVKKFLATRYGRLSVSDIESYIADNNADPKSIFIAVCRKDDGRHIGNIKLQALDRVHESATISIVIGETGLWGKGIGTEAVAMSCRYGFETLGLHRLDAGCYAENVASMRIFEKCGFAREGLSRGVWRTDRGRHDAVRLGMLRTDEPLWRRYLGT